ncbi:formimidoylglutamate deiminase [Gemmobacter denitrificans]|uniref:Formimidoylglutamate deiminase n=1 Tax=Gemmobacter denitrificans TaxID=3123040 RepID=A0ABU8BZZ0_9RHOB
MTAIFAQTALLPDGWGSDVRLVLDGDRIASVTPDSQPGNEDCKVAALVPGLPNLHSHAFQRGMSALAESRGPSADSFWTWRDMMYRFALGVSPEGMQAIAEMAYVEMLEAGFTRVGEFHYLHHDRDGRAYADPAEMSRRILAAATETGINLTHLPVFYAHSDFGGTAPNEGQRRFIHDLDTFARLTETLHGAITRPLDRLGIAPHSLRAATGPELDALLRAHPEGPVHIHISEQQREVADSLRHSGQRPVEWLLAHQPVDARWCLIHATHLTDAERKGIATSGAVVGLCPVTEANLGDGLFPAVDYLAEGGRIGIGTDSNVEITASGELRLLEYGQRLFHRQRNLLAGGEGSTGGALLRASLAGGAQALGAPAPQIAPGAPADLVALHDPVGLPTAADRLIDRWVFGRDIAVADVWASGAHLVQAGRHRNRDRIAAAFARAVAALL